MSYDYSKIYFAKKRKWLCLIGSIVFVFLSIRYTKAAIYNGDNFHAVIFLFGVVFFILLTLAWLREILNKQPNIEVTEQGIVNRSMYQYNQLIEWQDINAFELRHYGQYMIIVHTKQPEKYLVQLKAMPHFIAYLNKMTCGQTIFLVLVGYDERTATIFMDYLQEQLTQFQAA
ncbi:STM3941 family protein [Kingella kingae]|uniref:STM3941 family protein n=1 Tax=Kingella kingae TaxID=504 RepID=UPI001E3D5DAF|nr:STM3941 family protein [Kingella kingae]MDK4576162.1 STM3941 family protein [Kingella kingae]MDK4582124.1 STM3941 family protein [Kingella kingae]MDK4592378.1 STM3941 family protein [Kingella kingae]MDK4594342.1 STM3941 family protein [Kingella kingae]MDK4644022.1 STM3941 family protein [Kingella kingae]